MPKLSEEFVGACLKMSDSEKSKLTDSERELYGQSSIKLKTFLNNVCSKDNTRYLELGVYRGSTMIPAMYGNKTLQAVGVENFKYDKKEPQYFLDEGWPNMKSQMYDVFQKYQFVDDVNTDNLKIIESDFEEISWSSQSKFDVIFMDIDPITPEIYDNFFKKVFNAFSRQCVVIFSGYSSEEIAPLLEQKVEQYSDRLVTEFKFQKVSSGNADSFGYYSGIAVYGFRKRHLQKMIKKSAISLISYDAHLLPNSIKTYYDYVDEIVLGLDSDRISWSRNKFSFDETALWKELGSIDTKSKISVIEENFHKSDVAIENDNYERNFLKEHCEHDIIVSIDADENLLTPKDFFIDYLPLTLPYLKDYDICMTWATPYKEIDDTTLVIADHDTTPYFGENQGFITHKDSTFTYARWTDKSGGGLGRLLSPLICIHYSLCRQEDDLHKKINNIGHSDLAETDPFFSLWKDVTLDNYHELKDFRTSGLGSAQWPSLYPVKTEQLLSYYEQFSHKAYL